MLFEKIFDKHRVDMSLASTDQSLQQLSPRLPELDERIINQRMSSSISQGSGKKLKRSKTMHHSTLTSISEPTTSNRKAKRTKSMKAGSEGTHVTSPGRSRDQEREKENGGSIRDEWDFPGSSVPETAPTILKNKRLAKAPVAAKEDDLEFPGSSAASITSITTKNRNTELGSSGLKTYGKMRRTKTMGGAWSSSPPYEEPKRRAADDNETERSRKRTRQSGEEELLPMLPKPRRLKRGLSVNGEALYAAAAAVEKPESTRFSAFQMTLSQELGHGDDFSNTSVPEPDSIQVPRSFSKGNHAQLSHSHPTIPSDANDSGKSIEGISMVKATNSDKTSSNLPAHKTPTKRVPNDLQGIESLQETVAFIKATDSDVLSLTHSVHQGLTSIIIPDTLTSSQKNEYKVVHLSSSEDNHRYSLPEMMEPAKAFKFTDASSTIPNDTPRPTRRDMSPIFDPRAPSFEPLSSPPITVSSRKMKRSKTEVGRSSQPLPSPVQSPSPPKSGKRKLKRRKTIGHSSREASVDELSFSQPRAFSAIQTIRTMSIVPLKDHDNTATESIVPTSRSTKRKAQDAELPGSQELGYPKEMYQPRLSARRSKSMSAQADVIAFEEFSNGLPMTKRRRSTKEKEKKKKEAEEVTSIEVSATREGRNRVVVELGEPATPSPVNDDAAAVHQANTAVPEAETETRGPSIEPSDALPSPTNPPQQIPVVALPKPRGRPPKAPHAAALKPISPPQEDDAQQDEVVQPKRGARPPKTAVAKSALVVADSDADEEESVEASDAVRERATKGVAKSKEIVGSDEDEDDDDDVDMIQTRPRGRPAKPATAKFASVTTTSKADAASSKSASKTPLQSTPTPDTAKDAQTPQKPRTPQQAMKAGTGTPHSPIHSGKVPYRVGLSRRNRIAPLLRIIRK